MMRSVCGISMLSLILRHFSMTIVGVKGVHKTMKTGYVNEGWDKEHHELWLDDIKAGKIPAQRSKPPAPEPGATVQI